MNYGLLAYMIAALVDFHHTLCAILFPGRVCSVVVCVECTLLVFTRSCSMCRSHPLAPRHHARGDAVSRAAARTKHDCGVRRCALWDQELYRFAPCAHRALLQCLHCWCMQPSFIGDQVCRHLARTMFRTVLEFHAHVAP
jgi:hypothetical protein